MPTLNFKGKSFVYNHHLAVKYHQLVPQPELSLTDNVSLHDNLIIHGDNLKALKALLPTYAGKIKCIYIDPPYNTGNEGWVYNDNVNSPMIKEWFGKVVDKEDLTRHDKWLCMMMPRIKLLRELLKEDGIIFVSIDDNEVNNLKLLLDEVFGDENYVATIIWQKNAGGGNDTAHIAVAHEYLLVYARDIKHHKFRVLNLPPSEGMLQTYDLEDDFVQTRGKHTLRNLNDFSIGDRPGLHYDIECPDGTLLIGDEHRWRCDENKFNKRISEDRIVFEKNDEDDWEVYYKQYINEQKEEVVIDEDGTLLSYGRKPSTLFHKLAFTGDGKKDLKKIFGFCPMTYPKPVKLIKQILEIATKKNDIILDAFAGSGTTAQATIELNEKDEGNRKYILIQIPEKIKQKVYVNKITGVELNKPKKGETKTLVKDKPFVLDDGTKLEYIVDIAKERLLRFSKSSQINIFKKSHFSFFELGEPIEMENILKGNNLPEYNDLARYVFYTATGEQFNPKKVNERKNFIGETKDYEVYLFYKPDIEYLRHTALTLKLAESLGKQNGKKRLVFAPAKYVDTHTLLNLKIEYCQLPFEIYRIKE
jgi:adenine-specific DNA-methyltransferase